MEIGDGSRRVVVLEITRSGGRFEGTLLEQGATIPVAFSGWFELLTLLETGTGTPSAEPR
ncbi:MAG: hypothetical protein ACREQ5_06195 [Candidatus Dormibacteria bacterium]